MYDICVFILSSKETDLERTMHSWETVSFYGAHVNFFLLSVTLLQSTLWLPIVHSNPCMTRPANGDIPAPSPPLPAAVQLIFANPPQPKYLINQPAPTHPTDGGLCMGYCCARYWAPHYPSCSSNKPERKDATLGGSSWLQGLAAGTLGLPGA